MVRPEEETVGFAPQWPWLSVENVMAMNLIVYEMLLTERDTDITILVSIAANMAKM